MKTSFGVIAVTLLIVLHGATLAASDLAEHASPDPAPGASNGPTHASPYAVPAAQDVPELEMPWAIGGVGGAYLLVEPGELEIELFKRDLNYSGVRTDLRAILAGPDRQVLEDVVVPHLGGSAGDPPGPVQRVVLRVMVERSGIYALNISTKGDRYGLNVAWGMRTNAAAYVIETARGHRDVRHEEPIVLLNADAPADVCFLPREGAFEIEVEGLPAGADELALYDEREEEIATLPVTEDRSTRIRDYLRVAAGPGPEGSAKATFPAEAGRGENLWCLHLPRGRAFVSIDGVTRWDASDRYRDQAVWTPDRASWFAHLEHRWLISPYQRTAWMEPGAAGSVQFFVHNNSAETRTVALSLECPGADGPPAGAGTQVWFPLLAASERIGSHYDGSRVHLVEPIARREPRLANRAITPASVEAEWSARLSDSTVTLDAGTSVDIEVFFTGPAKGAEQVCHVRATPEHDPMMTTFATVRVRGGVSPASKPLVTPLVLEPYTHENAQFGYLPDYPVDSQVYFDLENRGFVLSSRVLYRQVHDGWVATDISTAVVKRFPEFRATTWRAVSTKVAFDADNDVYLLARSSVTVALLHSVDHGESFTAYVLPGREDEPRTWDIEQYSGHNVHVGPPPVVRLTRTYRESESALRWRSTNDLDLFVTTKGSDGGIEMPEPLRLSDVSLGFSMHSGIPSTVVSSGSKVHVVWGEATDPDADRSEIPGVPAYVATYDSATGVLGDPVFLSFGPPPNDGHNTPSITVDGQGFLHVVVGTHGSPFQYLRSLGPNDAYAGWTEPVKTSSGDLRQTYVGLVSGADDALHLVFRQWRSGEEHLEGATWAALAYQRKLPGAEWETARVLVAPPLSEYSIYYHRLTVDRAGALLLSYDYWSTMWFYRNDMRGGVAAGSGRAGSGWGRAVLTSPDGGDSWSLW